MKVSLRIIAKLSRMFGAGRAGFPAAVYFIVNSGCNLKCCMCDIGMKETGTQFWDNMNSRADMSPELFETVIDEIARFRPLIAITSTEPLLYSPLPKLIRYASSRKLDVEITTNGFLLAERAEELIDSGVAVLFVSIDAPEQIHDSIRGVPGSFKKAAQGMDCVLKLRKKIRLKKIGVNCCISSLNQGVLVELLDFLRRYPIDSVNIMHMNYITPGMAECHNRGYSNIAKATATCIAGVEPASVNIDLLWEQLCEVKARRWPFAVNLFPELGMKKLLRAYYNAPETVVAKKRCSIPWQMAQIKSNGDMIVMTRCFSRVMGNVGSESFMKVWNGAQMCAFRKALSKTGIFPACTRCCGVL